MDKEVAPGEMDTDSFHAAVSFHGALGTGAWDRSISTGGCVAQVDRRRAWPMIRRICDRLDALRWIPAVFAGGCVLLWAMVTV